MHKSKVDCTDTNNGKDKATGSEKMNLVYEFQQVGNLDHVVDGEKRNDETFTRKKLPGKLLRGRRAT